MSETFDLKLTTKKLLKFFESFKEVDIRHAIHEGRKSLIVTFDELVVFDLTFGDLLLEAPEDFLNLMNHTLNFYTGPGNEMIVRIVGLPDSVKYLIREIRTEHLGKLVMIEGMIKRKSEVKPKVNCLEYLCVNPECSYSEDKIIINQKTNNIKTIRVCPKCKSSVELIHQDLIDNQILVVEENQENIENYDSQPRRINVKLDRDLVSPYQDAKTNPGSKIIIIGIIKQIEIGSSKDKESVNRDIILEANSIGVATESIEDLNISKEDEEKIKHIASKENTIDILVDNFAPDIFGHKKIKEGILLQQFGGVRYSTLYSNVRGDMHILLIGDPGAAKSQLLKATTKIAMKSVYVSGKSASGVGLTCSVIRDEITKTWTLEGGAMVIASNGVCVIDEIDKMNDEDTSSMHEGLEQQQISVAKANVRATLNTRTSVLCAANPKMGRFDPYRDIAKQINFPPALISRFDLIFILRDIPNEKYDSMISEHILKRYTPYETKELEIEPSFYKKYIAYSKRIKPELTPEAAELLQKFYVDVRRQYGDDDNEAKAVPIAARQIEGLVRLSQAYARLNLSFKITSEHAKKAIEIMLYSLEKVGIDPNTGKLDIDSITTGVNATTRDYMQKARNIVEILDVKHGKFSYNQFRLDAMAEGIPETNIKSLLRNLLNEKTIFEPRKDQYEVLR